MTRTTNARLAGSAFLVYIAAGIASVVLVGRAARGEGIGAKLASIVQHVPDMRVAILLSLLMALSALVLAVTLYSITREEDSDLAMLGLTCRVGEGLIGMCMPATLGLLWLATATDAPAAGTEAAQALGELLREAGSWDTLISATFFAVGSTLFCYLLLRGRMIPIALAWLGVIASILLVVCLPLQLTGLLRGPVTSFMWLPMLAFEVPFALWLLIKGVTSPARGQST